MNRISWSLYLGERRKRFRRNEGNPGTYREIKVKLKHTIKIIL